MDVTVGPSALAGTARAPPSKSYTHRAILAAGSGADPVNVEDPLWSADTRATAAAVEAFGGDVTRTDNSVLTVQGFDGTPTVPADVVDCRNSGTTMRLVTATAALTDGTTVLTGDGSLRSRPQGPLLGALEDLGAEARSTRGNGQAPLVVSGPIQGGQVSLPGDVSSQFVTALLMAGAQTPEGIEIELETALKSAPYVEITREVLEAFGVETSAHGGGFSVPGGQAYVAETYAVPGDFSSISYLLAAGAIAADEEVTVTGARPSAQGDTAIVDVLERMGAAIDWRRDEGTVTVGRSSLEGVEVSVADTPDLLPTIATLGAVATGETRIVDAAHVRYKETDRVSAMAEELGRLGVETTETADSLTIHGGELSGGTVDGRADHRIVMALAVAGLVAAEGVTIRGGEHVDVSFPDFFAVLESLGAAVER